VALRGVVHSANDFRKEITIKVRQQYTNRVGLARYETPRSPMRDVAQLARDLVDSLAGLFTHGSAVVEHSRNSGNGHACFTCDILDRDHSPRSGGESVGWESCPFWPISYLKGVNM
jgi:hypothetical protein